MRAFIAIELPPEIKDFLAGLEKQLKSTSADVKWVEPANIHLTLKFLGEIDDIKYSQVKGIIEYAVKDKAIFNLRLHSLGAFPRISLPRVIWVGIDKGEVQTKEIAQILEEKTREIGIPAEERDFSSHITIGRVRSGLNKEKLIQRLQELQANPLKTENLEFPVTKITLLKSTLSPKGPIYEILKEASLKAA